MFGLVGAVMAAMCILAGYALGRRSSKAPIPTTYERAMSTITLQVELVRAVHDVKIAVMYILKESAKDCMSAVYDQNVPAVMARSIKDEVTSEIDKINKIF